MLPFAGENRYTTASQNVRLLASDFYLPQLRRKRRIWIYLPPNYYHSNESYPVLYLQDGQNLFDAATSYAGEWGVDKSLNYLIANGAKPCIVVGIDNGHAKRMREYAPWDHPRFGAAQGNAYCRFLAKTLKPFIDQHFRTRPDAANTLIGGSSMGGLIAFYGALAFPEVFGVGMVFSPSFWYSPEITAFVNEKAPLAKSSRIIFAAGAHESKAQITNPMQKIAKQMDKLGFDQNRLHLELFEGAGHNEGSWGYMFGKLYGRFFG
jgi:predicted alpha/beta superfamily hydrolase